MSNHDKGASCRVDRERGELGQAEVSDGPKRRVLHTSLCRSCAVSRSTSSVCCTRASCSLPSRSQTCLVTPSSTALRSACLGIIDNADNAMDMRDTWPIPRHQTVPAPCPSIPSHPSAVLASGIYKSLCMPVTRKALAQFPPTWRQGYAARVYVMGIGSSGCVNAAHSADSLIVSWRTLFPSSCASNSVSRH